MAKTYKAGRPATSDKPHQPVHRTNHLIAIAIDRYRYLPRLYNCVRDAEALIEVLHREYSFEQENITTLFDEQATGENLVRLLEKLPKRFKPEDNLVLFFSGHGDYRKPQEEGFWVPEDARPDVTKDLLSLPEIKMYLNAVPCHHLVVILDACFGGSIFRRSKAGSVQEDLIGNPSRWGLSSGRLHPVLDGKPGSHSPFADSLIKQLKVNWDPIRADQLYAKITDDLLRLGLTGQSPDCGHLDLSGDERGMFYFTSRPERFRAEKREQLSFQVNKSTLQIVFGNMVDIKADAIVSSDDTMLSMSGGVSMAIRKKAGDKLVDFIHNNIQMPLRVGDVVETLAFNIQANYIFHAITQGFTETDYIDDEVLRHMTQRCLELAEERQLQHLAFPAIGTGNAGMPYESSAQTMVDTICSYLLRDTSIKQVTIVLYHKETKARKEGLRNFYQRSIKQGAAWGKMQQYLDELPDLLRLLHKEQWMEPLLQLRANILDRESDEGR